MRAKKAERKNRESIKSQKLIEEQEEAEQLA